MDGPKTPAEWYAARHCTHAHCPLGCEHPGEALAPDGRMLCMRCLVLCGVETEVEPCVPGVCD